MFLNGGIARCPTRGRTCPPSEGTASCPSRGRQSCDGTGRRRLPLEDRHRRLGDRTTTWVARRTCSSRRPTVPPWACGGPMPTIQGAQLRRRDPAAGDDPGARGQRPGRDRRSSSRSSSTVGDIASFPKGRTHRLGRIARLQGVLGLLLGRALSSARRAARPFSRDRDQDQREADDQQDASPTALITGVRPNRIREYTRIGNVTRGRSRREERDDELVERQRERDQRAGRDPRRDQRQRHPEERRRLGWRPGPAPPPRSSDRSTRAASARSPRRRSCRRRRARR